MAPIPLASLQLYCKNVLDGLLIPGATAPLVAYITPPTVSDLDGPVAIVQGARLRVNRQTAPRRAGFKRLAWVVDVYLAYETTPDSETVDLEFPQIIDTVMAAFWKAPIPTFIGPLGDALGTAPDVLPDGSSQVWNTGEDMELEYPPERVPATLRMLYYAARLGVDIEEVVQA